MKLGKRLDIHTERSKEDMSLHIGICLDKWVWWGLVIGLVVLLILNSCVPQQDAGIVRSAQGTPDITVIHLPLHNVYRFVDDEAGVICYILARKVGGEEGGISCLPISETKLDR